MKVVEGVVVKKFTFAISSPDEFFVTVMVMASRVTFRIRVKFIFSDKVGIGFINME